MLPYLDFHSLYKLMYNQHSNTTILYKTLAILLIISAFQGSTCWSLVWRIVTWPNMKWRGVIWLEGQQCIGGKFLGSFGDEKENSKI